MIGQSTRTPQPLINTQFHEKKEKKKSVVYRNRLPCFAYSYSLWARNIVVGVLFCYSFIFLTKFTDL